jgi:hypothetical protein
MVGDVGRWSGEAEYDCIEMLLYAFRDRFHVLEL